MNDLPTRNTIYEYLKGYDPDVLWNEKVDEFMKVLWAYADGHLVSLDAIDRRLQQFVFDIVMNELNMDEADMDDQAEASEKVDEWMACWAGVGEGDKE